MSLKAYITFFLLIAIKIVYAQTLFVEENQWGKSDSLIIPEGQSFRYKITSDTSLVGDTLDLKILYPSGQTAAAGSCKKSDKGALIKRKDWKFYYENGALWSTRSYNGKGRLISIKDLKSPTGTDLPHGYARYKGKHKTLTGYNYVYDQKGNLNKIAEYGAGKIMNYSDHGKYSAQQLERIKIRTFDAGDGEILEELSLEEAYEEQKNSNKTILLNATNSWNGWSKKGYKKLFSKPHIAKYIKENFILAYLDIEDPRPITLSINGEDITYEGADFRRHGIINYALRIRATPTFFFLGPNLEILHSHQGIEVKEPDFMKILDFFLSGEYQNMSWKEYKKKD